MDNFGKNNWMDKNKDEKCKQIVGCCVPFHFDHWVSIVI